MTEPTARIEAALSHLGSEHEPPVGWEARVLAATGASARRARWWPWASGLALAIGAAVIAPLMISGPKALELALSHEQPRDAVATRGVSPQLGDTLVATATGGRYRVVWVYHNNDLVAACPGAGVCEITGDATVARVKLDAIGDYTAIAFSSVVPLPPPRGTLDLDSANASMTGAASTKRSEPVR